MLKQKRRLAIAGWLVAMVGVALLTGSRGMGTAAASAETAQPVDGACAISESTTSYSERARALGLGVRQAALLHRNVTRRDTRDRRVRAVVRRQVVRATRRATELTVDVIAFNRQVHASSEPQANALADLVRLNNLVLHVDREALQLRSQLFKKRPRLVSARLLSATDRLSTLQAKARRQNRPSTVTDGTPSTPTPTPSVPSAPLSGPVASGPLNLNPPDGYVFHGGGVISTAGPLKLGNNCTITGVNFTGGGSGLQIRGSGNTIRECTFGAYSWVSLILWAGNDNVIDDCTFNGVTGSGANIQVIGGKRNRITNNVTRGGVTAIAFLYSRSTNGGGVASLIENNVVSGNTCSGFSEEGITFDVIGNRPADVACLEYDGVQAVSGRDVTLSSLPFPSYVGYDMIFLSGALSGRTRSIVAQSGSRFTLDGAIDGVAAGDRVVIGAAFKQNLITGNTVTANGNAILLYGMAFGNRIENNTVPRGNIKVESIDNLVIASGSATRTYGRAPCGFNTVVGNAVVAGTISLEYYAIPMIADHANTYPAYTSVGNNVMANQCVRVNANRQVCYIAGNSGSANLSGVTLSPCEMVP